MLDIRRRIPVLDSVLDSCRLLPESIQVISLILLMPFLSFLIVKGFNHILYILLFFEIFFIFILLQKNIYYRRISKIENAISNGIIWVKTREDANKIYRYFIISTITLLLILLWNIYYPQNHFIIVLILLCLLYFLKGLFYLPLVHLKLLDEGRLEIADDFNNVSITLYLSKVNRVEILENSVKFMVGEDKFDFALNFNKKEERTRLRMFLTKILLYSEVK